jgi:hypothetical protein
VEDEKVTSHLRRSFDRLRTIPENTNPAWLLMAMPGASKPTMIPTAMPLSLPGEAGHAARRTGIEASGGCERAMVVKLRMEGFEVIVFQQKQVRGRAMFRLQRAKPSGGLRRKPRYRRRT